MEKILVTIGEKFSKEGKKILAQIGDSKYLRGNRDTLLASIEDRTVLVIGIGHVIDREMIDKAPNLKIIASATTGLDHVDLKYAQQQNITVLSLKGETEFLRSITPTAELSLGLMIALIRNTHAAYESVKRNEWDRDAYEGHTLSGKTLGVIGIGRLGSLMAEYGKALGMDVIYTDPEVDSIDYKKVSFNDVIKQSDVISIHVHLNDENERMFNAKVFEQMKSTAFLINTSRGQIVDESALLAALATGTIAGYATDVLANELSFPDSLAENPLITYAREHDNVIITPHIGGMTVEAREATDIFIAKKIKQQCERT